MMPVIRVGFVFYQVEWLGGINYLRNLFTAIQCLPKRTIEPVLFAGRKTDVAEFNGLADIVRTSILDRYRPQWWVSRSLVRLWPRRDLLLYGLLHKHNIDVLSHYGRLWKGCSIPTIGWIPDFQHKHLPKLFSANDRLMLDDLFSDIVNQSDAVIVSSQSALSDLNLFFKEGTPPAHILRFVSCIREKVSQSCSLSDLNKRYGLDRPWFYVPNQFWEHKNHMIVIKAMRLLKRQNISTLVVTTGSTNDYRNPDYFPSILERVRQFGLQEDFKVLGIVPYSDVVALMKNSLSVINPSLYEGWSTSVEEAKAMGKKILLSDIAVHREQKPDRGLYFDVDDAKGLARLMAMSLKEYNETDENAYQVRASNRQHRNIVNFAKQYERIVYRLIH